MVVVVMKGLYYSRSLSLSTPVSRHMTTPSASLDARYTIKHLRQANCFIITETAHVIDFRGSQARTHASCTWAYVACVPGFNVRIRCLVYCTRFRVVGY